jgi:hypothetical protein
MNCRTLCKFRKVDSRGTSVEYRGDAGGTMARALDVVAFGFDG